MQMRGAVNVLVRGTVKSLKWRLVFIGLFHMFIPGSVLSPLLFIIVLEALSRELRSGVPWEDLYADDLVIIAESIAECVGRLFTWKEAMEKKGLRVNAGKTKIMTYGTGLDLLQSSGVSMHCLSHWSGQQLQMYTLPGNCMLLGWQTTEGSPSWAWQAGGGSFLLLPRRHALSCELSSTTCENRLEDVQGAAIRSVFSPPLFQDMWPCVQLLCVECNAPCHWDLAIDKTKPPTSAVEWQDNDQTDLQCQAARCCHYQVQWITCAAWHWGNGPHFEGEKALLVWTCEQCLH